MWKGFYSSLQLLLIFFLFVSVYSIPVNLFFRVLKVRRDPFPCGNDLEICQLLWSNVEDKNAVLNMVNLNSGKTLKEELVKGDYRDERCEEVFKLFKV